MNKLNLTNELAQAKRKLRAALAALIPKHTEVDWAHFASARAEKISLERKIAADDMSEYADPVDFPVKWDLGAPIPHVITNGHHTFLTFYVHVADPNWDGTSIRVREPQTDSPEPIAIVRFHNCLSVKLGSPNDEVLHGHPLSGKGLEGYSVQIVRNSKWIKDLEKINSVHPNYKPDLWRSLSHYIFWFHDETFECLAQSYAVEVVHSRLPEVLANISKRILEE